jgi:hypothetical protein
MKYSLLLFSALLLWACDTTTETNEQTAADTTAQASSGEKKFIAANSDKGAIAWADAVMKAQGGQAAWDSARYFHWTFFGRRNLLWDKKTGRVRIENIEDSTVYLINIKTDTGRVWTNGSEMQNAARLPELVQQGKSIWNNDSYWIFMPFKLKDPGVTLYYAGMMADETDSTKRAAVVEMHFDEVGDTPQNKYRIYINPSDSLVHAWAYYNERSDEQPALITPWQDYQEYNGLKLSGDRGDGRLITNIWVKNEVADTYFTKFWPTKTEQQNTNP